MTGRRTSAFAAPRATCVLVLGAAAMGVGGLLERALRGEPLFSDDAYYYIVSARNLVETGRFSFDGRSEMHGFHPLWFWVQAAGFAALGSGPPAVQYRLVMAGQVLGVLAAYGLCAALAWRWRDEEPDGLFAGLGLAALALLLGLPLGLRSLLCGMELALALPLLCALAALVWRGRLGAAGGVAALLVAARLDALVYVVAPLTVAVAWRPGAAPRDALARGAALGAPALAFALVFMGWHAWRFGEPMPIHGVLKSSLPAVHLQWHQVLGSGAVRPHPPRLALVALAAALPLLAAGRGAPALRAAGRVAVLLGVAQLASFLLFQRWTKLVPPWYWGLPAVCAGFALLAGIASRAPRAARLAPAAVALGVLALQLVALPGTSRSLARLAQRGPSSWFLPTVRFMRSTAPGALWATTDAGALAFWSERPVMNLDGLVNDRGYQEALCRGELAAVLARRGVRYLIVGVWDRPQLAEGGAEPMYAHRVAPDVFAGDYEHARYWVHAYGCGADSDTLRLPRSAELWRSPAFVDGRARARTVVFDLARVPDVSRWARGGAGSSGWAPEAAPCCPPSAAPQVAPASGRSDPTAAAVRQAAAGGTTT